MVKGLVFVILFLVIGFVGVLHPADSSSDAPEYTCDSTALFKSADSYEHALQGWKTPEDISTWIAHNFSYDMARAMRLSESQRVKNNDFSIYTPSELFTKKRGVCVDLPRFDVVKHLGLWDIKPRPPPGITKSSPSFTEPHIDYSDSQLPSSDRARCNVNLILKEAICP